MNAQFQNTTQDKIEIHPTPDSSILAFVPSQRSLRIGTHKSEWMRALQEKFNEIDRKSGV